MTRLYRCVLVAVALAFVAGCGGSSKPVMLPVASPLIKWEPPAEEDLTADGAAKKKAGDDDDGWGDETPAEKPAD